MTTIRQVAAAARVSPATASRVLGRAKSPLPVSEATRRRVREAAQRLGYRVNYHMQAVATGRANAIGLTIESQLNPVVGAGDGNFYFDAVRRGVEYTTQEAGLALVSIRPGRSQTALQWGAEFLLERRVDALVVPCSNRVQELAHLFEANASLPVVMVNPMTPIQRPSVKFDISAAMQRIVDHVRELGHREVLWFGPEAAPGSGATARRQMFIEAAWAAGIHGSVCTVLPDDQLGSSERLLRIHRGRSAIARRIADPARRWTAVVTYNDFWAIDACAALREANLRVPEDVSVVGFDNLIADFCIPPLTTVDHRFYEMGRRAGELTARLVDMDPRQRADLVGYEEMIEPLLVVRGTTGPAPPIAGRS